MLHSGYWLFEFISISSILKKAPSKYGLAFLHSETDDSDLTYFVVSQTKVIRHAIEDLHAYIDRKTKEVRAAEAQVRSLNLFNHRQGDLLRHALKHPYQEYTIESHRKSHGVVYQTARTDLLDLSGRGLLDVRRRRRRMIFTVPADLGERMSRITEDGPTN
jgi:Fic family protein